MKTSSWPWDRKFVSRSVASPKKTSEKIDKLCVRQRNHTLLIMLKRNRRQWATSEFCGSVIWCRNYGAQRKLSAKSLSSVWRVKCSGGENDRRVLGIQCGSVKFFCGREASTNWWRQRKEKSTQFKCEKTKRKCCRILFPDSDQHVSVNYLKYLCTPVND